MELDLADQRQQAHRLLDMLPPEKLSVVHSLLGVLAGPLARSLAMVPIDDEELTDEMIARLDSAKASLNRGEGIPHEAGLILLTNPDREGGDHTGLGASF